MTVASAPRLLRIVPLLIVAIAGLSLTGASAAGPISFTAVTPARVAAPDDYASQARGYWWDFRSASHYSATLTRGGFTRPHLERGWFVGKTRSADPKVWLQDMNIPGTNPTPNEGAANPIDTSRYRYVTTRLCTDKAAGLVVYWFRDMGTFGAAGFRQASPGCGFYSFDLVKDRLQEGSLDWTAGPVQTIALKPFAPIGTTLRVDYVTLTVDPPGTAQAVTATWKPNAAHFTVALDDAPSGAHATPLAAQAISAKTGKAAFDLPAVPPGRYYLIARSGNVQTASPAFRVNSPPGGRILDPSYASGPDYATTVLKNPWDMSQRADIAAQRNVKSVRVSGGVYSAINTNDDPGVALRVQQPIDTSRFYYLTYRMRVAGQQDILHGSVARVFWQVGPDPAQTSTTEDIVDYEGWQTVTLDLRNVLLEPSSPAGWAATKAATALRLDPHEFPTPHRFDIDDVKLTGDRVADGASFDIRYSLTDGDRDRVTAKFFFSTKRGERGSPIACGRAGPRVCRWNLTGVKAGDYYLAMLLNDGHNQRTVYSETPLLVRPGGAAPAPADVVGTPDTGKGAVR